MSLLTALADGCQRVLRGPAVIAGLWLVYVLVPAPVGIDFSDSHLGLIEASSIDPVPALLSVIRSREALTYAVLITFLLGGVLDRFARNRATRAFGFFGAAGMHFFRFLRITLIAIPLYALVFLWIYPALPADVPASYVVLAAQVLALNAIFDFARVRMVVEDRRSAIGAVVASLRFVRRNMGGVFGIIVINAGIACATWWLAAAFDIGTTLAVYAYLLARALLRLIFMASAIALFQSRLAHAGYVARPIATWPESPAADAVLPR